MSNFIKEKNKHLNQKLTALIDELPAFCMRFFLNIESTTALLTRINYANDLKIFFYFLVNNIKYFKALSTLDITHRDLEQISSTDIELFLQYLSSYTYYDKHYTNQQRGKARKLSTVKRLFRYLFEKELISSNISEKVHSPKFTQKEIVRLEVDEVVRMLNQAEYGDGLSAGQKRFHTKLQKRDVAMLTLFLGTGIRISECVGLNVSDVNFDNNSFKIIRKGGNEAILYFSQEVADALIDYLNERSELLCDNLSDNDNDTKNKGSSVQQTDALFISLQKRRISTRAVQNLVKKYSDIVTPLKNISPHKLRSTYGTTLYRETNDIFIVADVLGHKDVNTTKKHYAAISDDLRRNVAGKVKLRDKD